MNVVEPPPLQPGDDLDGLLRTFLRSQLPQPWPSPPRHDHPDADPTIRRTRMGRNLMRSRWALAASVALLLFGSWMLPSRFAPEAKLEHGPNGPVIGSDDVRREMHREQKKQKQIEKKTKTGLAADEGDQLPELEESDVPRFR
jgi:hypothetical protein